MRQDIFHKETEPTNCKIGCTFTSFKLQLGKFHYDFFSTGSSQPWTPTCFALTFTVFFNLDLHKKAFLHKQNQTEPKLTQCSTLLITFSRASFFPRKINTQVQDGCHQLSVKLLSYFELLTKSKKSISVEL